MKIINAVTKTLSGIGIIAVVLLTTGIWCISSIIRVITGFARSIK